MIRCVVDTNTLIYYLNQVGGKYFRRRFDQWVRDGAVISVVIRIAIHPMQGTPNRADCPEYHSLAPNLSDQSARRFGCCHRASTHPAIGNPQYR